MKKSLKKTYQLMLKSFVARYLKRNKFDIIAITGSVGKTSTKDAVHQVLSAKYRVSKNQGNYNNEIGIPLSILKLKVGGFPLGWGKNILFGGLKSLAAKNHFDKIILEMGADHPGDIKYLTSFIKPSVVIITRIASAHLEFFCSLENIAQEKGALVESLNSNGWAILNYDDPNVRKINKRTKAKVFYFGLDRNADLYADEIKSGICGIDFRVHYKKESVKAHLNIIGKHLIYSVLAGIACGLVCDMSLEEAVKAIKNFQTEKGRLNLAKGINGSIIIDDTYNANPESMKAAIQTLNDLSDGKKRRIAVLADMLELGIESAHLHYNIGENLVGKVDYLLTYGEMAKNINQGFTGKNSFWFSQKKDVVKKLKSIMRTDDLILVKGSRGMRMEKIVESLKS